MTQMYCYVADLLGFKIMILNLPPKQQADRVEEWIKFVSEGINKFNLPKYHLVSDTIFVGADNDKKGLENLLRFSRYMLEIGISRSFPLRGAIAFGHVTWNEHISFGKAIVDAYNLANNQEWIGTICQNGLPHVDSSIWRSLLIARYPVPMKGGEVVYRSAVIWEVPSFNDLIIVFNATF